MQFWFGVVAGLFTGWIFDYFFGWRPRGERRFSAPVQPLGTPETPAPDSIPLHGDKPVQESNGESNA